MIIHKVNDDYKITNVIVKSPGPLSDELRDKVMSILNGKIEQQKAIFVLEPRHTSLQQIAGLITNLYIDKGDMCIDVEILSTDTGKIARTILDLTAEKMGSLDRLQFQLVLSGHKQDGVITHIADVVSVSLV